MEEQLKAGAYTALVSINIRAAMITTAGIVGGYRNGDPFTVFQVYPESDGIVWGRVSSNEGGGKGRYVALRVNNHPKAKLERAFEGSGSPRDNSDAIPVIDSLITQLEALRDILTK